MIQRRTTSRVLRATSLTCVAMAGVVLTSCASQPTPKAKLAKSKEYFAESEYGVKASPRLTSKDALLPRGGGRDQLGKAYKVKGNWYKPKEDPNYVKVGRASWYGDAFHGRLTANGEIYDMTHLTAAHPTMPLPSYARVTNTKNGNSVQKSPPTSGKALSPEGTLKSRISGAIKLIAPDKRIFKVP